MHILRVAPALRLPPRIGRLDYACADDAPLSAGDIAFVPFRGRRVAALVLEEATASEVPLKRLTHLDAETRVVGRLDPAALRAFFDTAALGHIPPPWLVTALVPTVPKRAPSPGAARPAAATGPGFQAALLRHRGDVLPVYAERIRSTARALRQTIVAAPDIVRAETLAEDLRNAGLCVTLFHHDLSAGARWKAWNALADGICDALVATKAGVLAPAPRLGLVIIDGEDDADHVQADAFPYYDGRTVLERRARAAGADFLAASQTPRFATAWRAKQGAWQVVAPAAEPASCRVIPLRQEPRELSRALLSGAFVDAAREAVQSGKNVIALLNRAVQARALRCADCGRAVACPTCGQAFAVDADRLRCLRCGETSALPASCPTCGSVRLAQRGPGVDAVAGTLQAQLPGAAVRALTRDRDPDVFGPTVCVTTETIFKTARPLLDAPVGLVAALEADAGLGLPDYRAVERVWAQLERLAKLARRNGCPLLLQAWEHEHPVLAAIGSGDVSPIVAAELADRKRYGFPPFRSLWLVHPTVAVAEAERLIARALPDADLAVLERTDRRRAVRSRPTIQLRTEASDADLAAALATLPDDWIVEPEPERFS